MNIYDCTTFYSEKMMLDVRFNILHEKVHKFVVVESSYSHSGQNKKLESEKIPPFGLSPTKYGGH